MKKTTILKFLLISTAFAFFQLAFASNNSLQKSSARNVLEVVTFSKKPNYTNEQVVKRSDSVTAILKSYPGFISRQFAENTKEKNQWIDIVHWASLHDALAAASKIVKTEQMKKFMSVMYSYKMYHFHVRFNASK